MDFRSHSQVKTQIEKVTGKLASFTNEGISINLTKDESANEADNLIALLKRRFDNVICKGRKYKTIYINYNSQKLVGLKVLSVNY